MLNVCGIRRRSLSTQWELSTWASTSRGIGVAATLPLHSLQPKYSLANGSYAVHWLFLQSFLYRSTLQTGHCMTADPGKLLARLAVSKNGYRLKIARVSVECHVFPAFRSQDLHPSEHPYPACAITPCFFIGAHDICRALSATLLPCLLQEGHAEDRRCQPTLLNVCVLNTQWFRTHLYRLDKCSTVVIGKSCSPEPMQLIQ